MQKDSTLNSCATPTLCAVLSVAWPHSAGTYSTSPARCVTRTGWPAEAVERDANSSCAGEVL